jgi:hypothetical protein
MSIGTVTGGGLKIIINKAIKKTFFAAFWVQLPVTYPTTNQIGFSYHLFHYFKFAGK